MGLTRTSAVKRPANANPSTDCTHSHISVASSVKENENHCKASIRLVFDHWLPGDIARSVFGRWVSANKTTKAGQGMLTDGPQIISNGRDLIGVVVAADKGIECRSGSKPSSGRIPPFRADKKKNSLAECGTYLAMVQWQNHP